MQRTTYHEHPTADRQFAIRGIMIGDHIEIRSVLAYTYDPPLVATVQTVSSGGTAVVAVKRGRDVIGGGKIQAPSQEGLQHHLDQWLQRLLTTRPHSLPSIRLRQMAAR